MDVTVLPMKSITGVFSVPGDKSISHRAVMFGGIANGVTRIKGFLAGDDCLSTIKCFEKLGIVIEQSGDSVVVHGKGLYGLTKPDSPLDVGNSGTTIRLLSGLLSAQKFNCEISGDSSIVKRPMDRVIQPLSLMGAKIKGINNSFAPLSILGSKLNGITYKLPVASAQVKSAIILASLYAAGQTVIEETIATRNHTEIMLNYFGADIEKRGNLIYCNPIEELYAKEIVVPGDISSAAFLMVAASILPDSSITITNVGINETRTGIITALKEMGGNIELTNVKKICGDFVADINVKTAALHGVVIGGDIIPKLIDELPVIAVCACFCNGTTVIKDSQELKHKESNRIKTMVTELTKLGAIISETDDGMIIEGGSLLKGTVLNSHNDHRVAMSLAICALSARGNSSITGGDCVNISFPNFYQLLSL